MHFTLWAKNGNKLQKRISVKRAFSFTLHGWSAKFLRKKNLNNVDFRP